MTDPGTFRRTALAAALALLPAACAPQAGQAPAAPGMAGMDMAGMMSHCAQMHREQAGGQPLPPDMQAMMAHCDEMDRSMGEAPGTAQPGPAPAPAATRSR